MGECKMATNEKLKQQLSQVIDRLPEPSLVEVATFLEFLQYREFKQTAKTETPFVPVALGGLWQGVHISDDDLTEVRREMWLEFGEREL
jgi:hypothetical protein